MNKDVQATYEKTWQLLYQRMRETLEQVGTETGFRKKATMGLSMSRTASISTVLFHDLNLLQPRIIKAMQDLLSGFPLGDFSDHRDSPPNEFWPEMGLIIRSTKFRWIAATIFPRRVSKRPI